MAIRSTRHPKGMPPGPTPIPFYGNLVDNKSPHRYMTNLVKEYGDVYTLKIAGNSMVVLNSIDVIKEALVKNANDYAGRPKMLRAEVQSEGYKDILFGDFTNEWKLLRKQTHEALRTYVSGENLQRLIHESTLPNIKRVITEMNGEPFNIRYALDSMVSTVIASLCFGNEYAPDDAEFLHMIELLGNIFLHIGNGFLEDYISLPKYLETSRVKRARKSVEQFLDFVQDKINQHRVNYNEENIKDFIDNMIKFQNDAKDAGIDRTEKIQLNDVHIRQLVYDMFIAGTDTVGNTAYWAIAYMLNYPDVQAKVHQELDDVLGQDRLPQLSDRKRLPYCEAVIHEIMRIRPVAALAITHSTTCNTKLRDYKIPKDTLVTINLAALHWDEKYWKDPEEFRPERFFDKENNKMIKPDGFMPFSAGRRVCVGEVLAKPEVFLIFTSLLQNFVFTTPPGEGPPGLEEYSQVFILRCHPYKVVVKKRNCTDGEEDLVKE
ncbi:steroid 17-alpha-hydroxylase/17,20 lyase-like [Glandiceps talaboti]